MKTLEERFWPKVGHAGADECWPWIGSRNPAGYGQINNGTGKAPKKAHRVAWELLRGEIPPGLVLDHLCRVRHCVNPYHLDPVTNAENIRRGDHSNAGAFHLAKTHCPSGHEYDEANTYMHPKGYRSCRTCSRVRVLANYYRDKAPYRLIPTKAQRRKAAL